MQERKNYYVKNPTEPLLVTITKEIVPNIIVNPDMIVSVGTYFVTAMKHNVVWMRKKIMDL